MTEEGYNETLGKFCSPVDSRAISPDTFTFSIAGTNFMYLDVCIRLIATGFVVFSIT